MTDDDTRRQQAAWYSFKSFNIDHRLEQTRDVVAVIKATFCCSLVQPASRCAPLLHNGV